MASSIRPEVSIQGHTQSPYLEINTSVDGALHLGRYGPLTDSSRLGLRIDAEFFRRVQDSVRFEASFDCGATWQRMVAVGTGAFSTDQSSDSLRKLRF